MAYTINVKDQMIISQEQVDMLVDQEIQHPDYQRAFERAKIFNTYHEVEFNTTTTGENALLADKKEVLPQGGTEGSAAYLRRLDRTRLFPLESKFLSGQKRIYDDKKVDRKFPEKTQAFWDYKVDNFDDKGSTITQFYRDKVLFVKETLGFGGIGVDVMMNTSGKVVLDSERKPIPYAFIIRPHEIWNYGLEKGVLTFVILRQQVYDYKNEPYYKWTAYTPERIKVWHSEEDGGEKELKVDIVNPFKEVPVTLLHGESDSMSSFNIGRPRRWHLHGLYAAMAELFYDLMQGTQLFAHPIPVIPESIAKQMAGVVNEDQKFDNTVINEKVGFAIITPDDMPITGNLLYQADMKGLEHLTGLIFGRMLSMIFNLAMYRDKSIVKSNVSGDAKQMDGTEERGLLASTAGDMELIEMDIIRLMSTVREEDVKDIHVKYSKHYDLSSAQEIFSDIVEMAQYNAMTLPVYKYLLGEYLRKRSAPQEIIEEAMEWLDKYGLPESPADPLEPKEEEKSIENDEDE